MWKVWKYTIRFNSVIDNFTHAIKTRGTENGTEIANIKEQTLAINIDLPDEFSKVSSDDEIDIGRKLDKGNLLLTTMIIDNKTGFNNLNTGLTDIKTGLNNLTTMMYPTFRTLSIFRNLFLPIAIISEPQ